MKGRTLIILALVCAGLAWFSFKDEKQEFGANLVNNEQPFKNLDINQVSKVTIHKGGRDLALDKTAGNWRASNKELDFPVNFEKLRDFLLAVRDMKLIEDRKSVV